MCLWDPAKCLPAQIHTVVGMTPTSWEHHSETGSISTEAMERVCRKEKATREWGRCLHICKAFKKPEENKTKQGWGELHEINQKKMRKVPVSDPKQLSIMILFIQSHLLPLSFSPSDARSARAVCSWGLWDALILNQLLDFRGSSPAKTQRHGVSYEPKHIPLLPSRWVSWWGHSKNK